MVSQDRKYFYFTTSGADGQRQQNCSQKNSLDDMWAIQAGQLGKGMSPMPLKRSKLLLAQCKATTPSGEPCKAKPYKERLCFFHSGMKTESLQWFWLFLSP